MPKPPQVYFVNGQVLFREGFGEPNPQVAMSDECCCTSTISRPGYVIRARDCCDGTQQDILLKLDNPPDWAFLKTFKLTAGGACFRFDVSDIDDALLATDPTVAGMDDFLLTSALYDRYDTCTLCRCANSQWACCYDYASYPDATLRTGFYYFEYQGVTARPELFTCQPHASLAGVWVKTEPFTVPNGIYTSLVYGGCTDGLTAGDWGPITTKYYSDAGCATPHGSYTDEVGMGSVTTAGMTINAAVPRAGITDSHLFSPDADPAGFDYCNTLILNNLDYSYNSGSGGTMSIYACCPEIVGI